MNRNMLQRIRLLYVESDTSISDELEKSLKHKVEKLYTASNGQDGLDKYNKFKPNMIITAMKMPIMNGIDMISIIRKENSTIPIIITSSTLEADILMESITLDVNSYIMKPINTTKLLTILETNAKSYLYEQEQDNKNKLMHYIMNSNENILVVTNKNNITFANNSFLRFNDCDNINKCIELNMNITDLFLEDDNCISKNKDNTNESFIENIMKIESNKRNVMMQDNKTKEKQIFSIKVVHLDDYKNSYLWTFSNITQLAIDNMTMKYKIYHDSLTDVYNRTKIDEVLQYELDQFVRTKHNVCFVIIDIDFFKKFNDTYGHIIGDEVLISMAEVCNTATRETDTFARWGGEEFVLLLPNTNIKQAIIVVENLKKNINKLHHKEAGSITASFGITQVAKDDTPLLVFKRADMALYKAKENGRNRYEIEELSEQ